MDSIVWRGGGHGGLWYCSILSIFSSGILVILILMCGIAVSSSPAVTVHVCGFSSLWKGHSVKGDPSRYCGTIHLRYPL